MNDAGAPNLTPPAHVRTVTLEQLEKRVLVIEQRGAEDYATLRDLSARVDTNHLVMLDALGQLARMMGGTLQLPPPPEVQR